MYRSKSSILTFISEEKLAIATTARRLSKQLCKNNDRRYGGKSYRDDICQCWPIFQSDTSVVPTDGLMRGMDVFFYFQQSAHSRHFDRGQLQAKKSREGCEIAWTQRIRANY